MSGGIDTGLPQQVSQTFKLQYLAAGCTFFLGDRVTSPIKDGFGKTVDFAGAGHVLKRKLSGGVVTVTIQHTYTEFVDERGEKVGVDYTDYTKAGAK